jgi:hypothetical protein
MILQSMVAHILQIQLAPNYSKKLLLLNIYTAKIHVSFSLSRLHVSAANIHLHAVQNINVNQRLLQCQLHKDGIPHNYTDVKQKP